MRRLVFGICLGLLLVPVTGWAISLDGDPFDADSWTQAFVTDYFHQSAPNGSPVNIVNFRMRPKTGSTSLYFESASGIPSAYTWSVSVPDGQYAVIAPNTPGYDGGNFVFTIKWPGGPKKSVELDWMEGYYDGSTVKGYACGTIWGTQPSDWNCTTGTFYDSAPAVPEPATWVLLLATGALGAIRCRRRT